MDLPGLAEGDALVADAPAAHRQGDQRKLGTDKDILYSSHHLSHAASAFLVSPYEEAAIITADGVGEWATTAWGVGKGNQIELEKEINFPHSVGLLFSAITAYLGFRVNDAEWKVMGLAPYGEPKYLDKFRQIVDIKEDGSIRLDLRYFAHTYSTTRTFNHRWEELFGQPQRPAETELSDFHRDIARSGQQTVEDIMVKMATHVQRTTGQENLCLAGVVWGLTAWRTGGCFRRRASRTSSSNRPRATPAAPWVPRFTSTTAVLNNPRTFRMEHAQWGPAFTNEQIEATLLKAGANYSRVDDEEELIQSVPPACSPRVRWSVGIRGGWSSDRGLWARVRCWPIRAATR